VQHLLDVPTVLPDDVLEVGPCPREEVPEPVGGSSVGEGTVGEGTAGGVVVRSSAPARPTPPDGSAPSPHQCPTDSTQHSRLLS
jgi:hypothetical protein